MLASGFAIIIRPASGVQPASRMFDKFRIYAFTGFGIARGTGREIASRSGTAMDYLLEQFLRRSLFDLFGILGPPILEAIVGDNRRAAQRLRWLRVRFSFWC